ncbi:MAG: hypothetical protein NTV61_03770 [Candidatus Bathyarchaeota archaeon]|nr:hypothetical protein [Candidatus Bathyarchaeota archaeon]
MKKSTISFSISSTILSRSGKKNGVPRFLRFSHSSQNDVLIHRVYCGAYRFKPIPSTLRGAADYHHSICQS